MLLDIFPGLSLLTIIIDITKLTQFYCILTFALIQCNCVYIFISSLYEFLV